MKLTVTTPLAIIVDTDDVAQLRAEDETGAFGILPSHADFLTALAVSVATWRDERGVEHHVAVRGGMLEVRDGNTIAIATPEAVPGDNLHRLESEVLARFRRQLAEERAARTDAQRLYLAAIRQIVRFLRAERAPTAPGTSTRGPEEGFEP
jgi:F-type H+-transporting ATPase subunit epsilon